jgi:hypothetical protein
MWNARREGEQEQINIMYPDIPPCALLEGRKCGSISVDSNELRRADWFWYRRPRKLVLSPRRTLGVLFFYLCLGITSMCMSEQTLAIVTIRDVAWVTLAAAGGAIFVDILRYAQWKWEYGKAIRRLLATATWD